MRNRLRILAASMKLHHQGAYCRLAKHSGGTWELADIEVPPDKRGLGIGSALMRKATAWADSRGVAIVAFIEPRNGLTREQIVAWNKRHGFRHTWFEFFRGAPKRAMLRQPI